MCAAHRLPSLLLLLSIAPLGALPKRLDPAATGAGAHAIAAGPPPFPPQPPPAHVRSDVECYTSANGGDYRGRVNVSARGHACQMWSHQMPHAHEFFPSPHGAHDGIGAHNFCRAVGQLGRSSPFCLTQNPRVRWDFCDVGPRREHCSAPGSTSPPPSPAPPPHPPPPPSAPPKPDWSRIPAYFVPRPAAAFALAAAVAAAFATQAAAAAVATGRA
eukprot:CAMPEP_0180005174 /NCGR_PEP_ID=MMETSP0984-20121128/12540_1 /TAXON_ID=483367 /ORGANISM="non described non described, Strain CCMP 2436" /LENGTH=215 /DNA_ID=CAMNT_0021925839 /DNA_START=175 /DNA_END=822 /DNA_ORIENTATION=+